ncbi:MAG: ATP-grasp domain-containing protein [PVC group bacterium]|nr:ATP-grasp domain-containing protein [PVC group bacterium]
MRNKYRVLQVFDTPYTTARDYDFATEFQEFDWMTEDDVYTTLCDNGHDVRLLGIHNDINPLIEEIKKFKPDVVFNLTEVFNQKTYLDKNFAGVLEMLEIPYTGASPDALLICNNKALSKKILSFHKIRGPKFYVFYRSKKVWLPKKLKLPLIVKPLSEEGSRGIALASVVDNEEAFLERVNFIHEKMNSDAIVEEYIEGRELYVSVLGNKKIRVLPPREVKFGNIPDDEPRIATYKAKWDFKYREKWGIKNEFAGKLPNGAAKKIEDVCKRAYRALNMHCYARFDIRLTPDGKVYIIEANANPCLAHNDEVGQSAEKAGISYNKLLNQIISLAFRRKR